MYTRVQDRSSGCIVVKGDLMDLTKILIAFGKDDEDTDEDPRGKDDDED